MNEASSIAPSEITPVSAYLGRRAFMNAGIAAASVITTGWIYRRLNRTGSAVVDTPAIADLAAAPTGEAGLASGFRVDDPMTPLQMVSNYNNFYEFTTDKEGVAAAAAGFVSKPWQVAVEGMVHRPRVFDIDDLMKAFPREERVYRMRCVEGWSMVIPWSGFPLAKLLERVEPMGGAGTWRSRRCIDPARMPGQRADVLPWPYVEGLRLDEAMHPLTLLAVGLYGRRVARPERRAASAGGALEVRLQGDQVNREDHVSERACPRRPGTRAPRRVRLLRQRQSRSRSSPMESGNRAADRRIRSSADVDVQRLWPAGGPSLCGHGLASQLLKTGGTDEGHAIRQVYVLAQLRRPGGLAGLGRLPGPARRQPGQFRDPHDRAAFSHLPGASTLVVTPASRITGWSWLGQFRRVHGTVRLLSRGPAFFDLLWLRPRGECSRHTIRDRQASLPDGGNGRPGADGATGGHVDRSA